jgi:CRP/FNR family transcriptional regulator, cyclic AMP receptor protein
MRAIGAGERFWGLLGDAERANLRALGRHTAFPAGATICVQGEPTTHVFILLAGWAKALFVTNDGHEFLLALHGPGDIVGELAGETGGYRQATVQAIDAVRSLIVGHAPFTAYLDANPGAGRAYRRVVTRRWTDAAAVLRARAVTTGAQRLARLLLDIADSPGTAEEAAGAMGLADTVPPLSQEELASLAGTSRATVTRALHSWRQRGYVRTGQRRITITDPQGLRQVAGGGAALTGS